ncbi:ComEC/Rec2 family competence protein [Sphingomonas alba]|uniref:ComEC family competence protein n=1 Tax=Sphingomonas alba TaxID=2908208 RepID=A0ABT0RIE8_9SPHN|nr:ComEC family competence protein [Sphingomonas alba]
MSAPNIEHPALPQGRIAHLSVRLTALRARLEAFLEAERGQLPIWAIAAFGAGIALWFALPDPQQWSGLLFLAAGVSLLGFTLVGGRVGAALGWFGLAMAAGCVLVWWRSEQVATIRLEHPRIVELTAKVARVEELAAKGDIRLTLAPSDKNLPPQVRVSIPADEARPGLAAGAVIAMRARLTAPPPMALPGSHDFARDAWFRGDGASGRSMGPVEIKVPAEASGLDDLRARLDHHVRTQLPGASGGIATTLVSGDQNALGEEDADAMRRSGLTHLLSVSGLHLAAVVGGVMFLTLRLLALSRFLALRFNLVLVGAGAGALAGIGYTLLTGLQVPTVRSCVAALLVLGGMALGREAISMRLVAVGALIVLLLWPESVAGASFQFSFAAVTAIVTLHSMSAVRRWLRPRDEGLAMRTVRGFGSLLLTGLVVELALVPFALFHFHRTGLYSVFANLFAIPWTTFVVMPLEATALFLDLGGFGAPFWTATGWAIDQLLALAHWVAGMKGAVATLPTMPVAAFSTMVAGGLWLCLWNARVRLLGLVPIALGAAGAIAAPAPDLLITGDGRHLAVVGADGRPAMLREKSGDFVMSLMSENSGFDGDPLALSDMPGAACSRDSCIADIKRGGRTWRVLATRSGQKLDWQPLTTACASADIVVSERWLPRGCHPRWLKLDRDALEATGGLAIYLKDSPRVATVAERVGSHPWKTPGP